MGDQVDNLSKELPEIISVAAQSYLGILALLSIALALLAYFFFSAASEKVKVGIFALIFAGVVSFGVAMFRAPGPEQPAQATPPVTSAAPGDASATPPATVNADGSADKGHETLLALNAVGVDYSVKEAAMLGWLADGGTLYPSISAELLKLLTAQRLKQPVYLDMIVYDYEQAAGSSSLTSVDAVDLARLKAAVLKSYNNRYGGDASRFDELLR